MDFDDGNNNDQGNNMNLGDSQIPMMPQQQPGQPGQQGRPGGLTAHQILTYLMKLDPEQRNAVISKNPQLRNLLVQIEQQRRLQIQRMQQQQQGGQPNPNQPPQNNDLSSANVIPLQFQQQGPPPQQQIPPQQLQQQQQQQQQSPQVASPYAQQHNVGTPGVNPMSAAQSPVDMATHMNTAAFALQNENTSFGLNQQKVDNLPKDKIPKKPLQKKGMKKKALTGGPGVIVMPQQNTRIQAQSTTPLPQQQMSPTNFNQPPPQQQQHPVQIQQHQQQQQQLPSQHQPPLQYHVSDKHVKLPAAQAPSASPVQPGPAAKRVKHESVKSATSTTTTTHLNINDPMRKFLDFDSPVLNHPYEWSERLKKEKMTPDGDLKIYESIISKDLEYLKYSSAIINATKENVNKVNDRVGVNGKLFNRILKDLKFYQQVKSARMESMKLPPEANELTNKMWGEGYSGYGNGFTNGKIEFVFPENSKMKYKDEFINDDNEGNLAAEDDSGENIPIRLEFDVDRDGFKLNDTFIWNSNDDDDTLKIFVDELIKDYKIEHSVHNIREKIINSIKEQIADQHPMVVNPNIDLRFPINLDITIANNQLVDRFDWDLMNQENNPEEFADTLCNEFSLSNEFRTAIAHAIREQCQIYLKSLYMIGYKFDGAAIISEDLKEFLRSGVDQNNVMMPRYLLSDFTPYVTELSIDNFERIIKERERESKRKKRGVTRVGRRGGFVLPDLSNMPKTFRTPLPTALFPGGISILDTDTNAEEYTDAAISVEIPAVQLKKLHEREALEKKHAEECRHEQNAVRGWMSRVRERRMRGETFTATVQVLENEKEKESEESEKEREEREKKEKEEVPERLEVRFRFGWR